MYYSLVESCLRHGVTAFGTSKQYKNLQKTQTRILKILHRHDQKTLTQNQIFQNNAHTTQPNVNHTKKQKQNNQKKANNTNTLNKTLNILNIRNIFKITTLTEFYKHPTLLQKINHRHNTRRRTQSRFQTPAFRTDYGKSSLARTLPTIMNEMPIELLNIEIKSRRKKLIKNYLLTNQN